jgi:hypothetical protein
VLLNHQVERGRICGKRQSRSRHFRIWRSLATSHRDTEAAAISELMRLNQMPTVEELRRGKVDLIQRFYESRPH